MSPSLVEVKSNSVAPTITLEANGDATVVSTKVGVSSFPSLETVAVPFPGA